MVLVEQTMSEDEETACAVVPLGGVELEGVTDFTAVLRKSICEAQRLEIYRIFQITNCTFFHNSAGPATYSQVRFVCRNIRGTLPRRKNKK